MLVSPKSTAMVLQPIKEQKSEFLTHWEASPLKSNDYELNAINENEPLFKEQKKVSPTKS